MHAWLGTADGSFLKTLPSVLDRPPGNALGNAAQSYECSLSFSEKLEASLIHESVTAEAVTFMVSA